ncbi:MAG: hypothetical protein E7655_08145 [Ruminococcaceae bacterium]|nr:hypothetical protein [Oscillospiraceae bacterium]
MFKNIKNLFKSKNENSRAFRMEMAEKISNKIIKYTAERVDDVELVIGREGSISLRNGQIIVLSGGNIVMRTNVEDMHASELLSLDGVIITAPDLEQGGKERTIIAYYKYFR